MLLRLIILIPLFLQPVPIFAQTDSTVTFSFAFADDNFFAEKQLNRFITKKIFEARDDYVTASFGFRYSKYLNKQIFSLNTFYVLLTDRNNNFRTDLLNLNFGYEKYYEKTYIQLLSGFCLAGNYGGRSLQNAFHNLMDVKKTEMQYSGSNNLSLYLAAYFDIYSFYSNICNISPFFYSDMVTNYYPSSFGYGFRLNKDFDYYNNGSNIELLLGNTNYYQNSSNFKNMFGKNTFLSLIYSKKIYNSYGFSFWYGRGLFGIDTESQFGVIVSYGFNIFPQRFSNFKFP